MRVTNIITRHPVYLIRLNPWINQIRWEIIVLKHVRIEGMEDILGMAENKIGFCYSNQLPASLMLKLHAMLKT